MKTASVFFPAARVAQLAASAKTNPAVAQRQAEAVAACGPWLKLSDAELRGLMFGNTITRSWHVLSDGNCPTCGKNVAMLGWETDAWAHPWKVLCPHCKDTFPKNDFEKFYRSGLDEAGIFQPARADRSVLGPGIVDDGEGYVVGDKRWRFIGYYLIWGHWWQVVMAGVRNLAAAYVLTGDAEYGRRAGVLLERVAELYPTFDFRTEGRVYQQAGNRGYVTVWHNACHDARVLGLVFDQVFASLTPAQREKVETRILRDTIANRPKIESNYPATDVALLTLHLVLGWPDNRAEVFAMLDPVVRKATAVDGVTGEKGIPGYAVHGPDDMAKVLAQFALLDESVLREVFQRYPQLHKLFRFHIDTWCLENYYPRIGDEGYFGKRIPNHAGVRWMTSPEKSLKMGVPELKPSYFTLFWRLYEITGDPAFVQILYRANGNKLDGLPHDIFTADAGEFQRKVREVLSRAGTELQLDSVNFEQWHLGILRSGQTAAWISYDAWGLHAHASGMNLGLYAKGLDLMADNGYPPVQFEGFKGKRFDWYWSTAAHNTVVVDGRSQQFFTGKTTLWDRGKDYQVMRFAPDMQPVKLTNEHVGFYLTTPGTIRDVKICGQSVADSEWKILNGEWQVAGGQLTGKGLIMCTRRFPGPQRVEYRAQTDDPNPCDLSAVLMMNERGLQSGVYFGFGSYNNQFSIISHDWRPARFRGAAQADARITPGKLHHLVCECDGRHLRHWVDGQPTMELTNDGMPHLTGPTEKKRFERTVALVAVSESDCYLIDLFHVGGGQDHAKFVHTFHGPVTTHGLNLQPAPDFGCGTLMRNFRCDPHAAPGWSVDWQIEDRLGYLPAQRDIHVRYTDLTEGAEANLCEGWLMVHGYESDEETWIKRVMVRRRAAESLFVAVIEPHEGHSNLSRIQRHGDRLEIQLADGRRDVFEWTPEGAVRFQRTP
ncbi:MAG: hypothetical protein PCFJNLEI_02119 [Verrucomicrobiae bacterium]|nr:hypothetical protein [Verrucomicrobiae bacterium]